MKILFISRIPLRGVSGGRYLAALFAERLSRQGNDVDFLVNYDNSLIFPSDIISSIRLRRYLPLVIGRNAVLDGVLFALYLMTASIFFKKKFDHVVIVPEEASFPLHRFFYKLAHIVGSKVHLLNFETPNWFNGLAPFKRDFARWDGWRFIADRGQSVISISKTSDSYARSFYGEEAIDYRWCDFPVYQEDKIRSISWNQRGNSAICISRMDPHKGVDGLLDFVANCSELDDFHLVLGSMSSDKNFLLKLKATCEMNKIQLFIHEKITHEEKFLLLGRVKYLVFPTYFEGLGMPPIEALASGCKVAAFELTVLKEISPYIEFAEVGEFPDLAAIVSAGLVSPPSDNAKKSVLKHEINSFSDFP